MIIKKNPHQGERLEGEDDNFAHHDKSLVGNDNNFPTMAKG